MSKKDKNNHKAAGNGGAETTVRNPSVCSCGGQALMEGILMIGPKGECQVVRDPEGKLVIKEQAAMPLKDQNKFFRLPLVRGVVSLIDSLRRGMGALFDSAEVAMTEAEKEEEEANKSKFEKWLDRKMGDKAMGFFMGISIVLAVILSVGLFMVLPLVVSNLVVPKTAPDIVKNLVEGFVRLLIFFGYMAAIAAMKDIRRVYMYHGAEHKTITCFEKGYELTVDNVRKCSRFHPRCGTAFLFVVVAISILITSIVPRFTDVQIANAMLRFLANLGVRLVLLPFIMGISYEFNRFCGRHENVVTRILRAPGLFMQRFTTREPDDSMMEVAIVALGKALAYEGIEVDYSRYLTDDDEADADEAAADNADAEKAAGDNSCDECAAYDDVDAATNEIIEEAGDAADASKALTASASAAAAAAAQEAESAAGNAATAAADAAADIAAGVASQSGVASPEAN